jgi:hypothetical protein
MKRKKAKKKAKKRGGGTFVTVPITLGREHTEYVNEIADYACVPMETVCAVMMACGLFQARRYQLPDKIMQMQTKLQRARKVMEANDPINARDIFGPPTVAEAAPAAAPDPARVPEVAP